MEGLVQVRSLTRIKGYWLNGLEICSGRNTIMEKIICAKYGVPLDSLLWNWNGGATGSSFTKAVGGLFSQGLTTAKVINDSLRIVVGRGDRARLWNDVFVDRISLKDAFPRVYTLVRNKAGVVRDFGAWEGNACKWDIHFRRPFFNLEVEQ
ncbi:hypothetical protein Dsin_000973 [Dipteronia sinensis]|uniref:Uncharacterized protein n=1 Tax=Dipteronia sinensis TaxID=43782 RepID=A0AAE0B485_9ROSI|nr:hypothetical protein Dsin_000973 [Dipteronia sinensis]